MDKPADDTDTRLWRIERIIENMQDTKRRNARIDLIWLGLPVVLLSLSAGYIETDKTPLIGDLKISAPIEMLLLAGSWITCIAFAYSLAIEQYAIDLGKRLDQIAERSLENNDTIFLIRPHMLMLLLNLMGELRHPPGLAKLVKALLGIAFFMVFVVVVVAVPLIAIYVATTRAAAITSSSTVEYFSYFSCVVLLVFYLVLLIVTVIRQKTGRPQPPGVPGHPPSQ